MSVIVAGDFITINNNVTIRISEISSIKPQSLIRFDPFTKKIIDKDFPKIIISTAYKNFEVLYTSDEERNIAIREIQEVINNQSKNIMPMIKGNSVNINVNDSKNINIVSQSDNVIINQEIKANALSKIKELINQVKTNDIENKEEILSCIYDIKGKIIEDKIVPQYSWKSLLNYLSQFSSIAGLALSIAQLFGFKI